MNITIGPAPTNWGREGLRSFYGELAGHPAVDRVCLGEIGCTKRNIFDVELYRELAGMLERAGKEVVLSTYVLPTNNRDIQQTRDLIGEAREIEINNIGVLNLWAREYSGKKATLGPYLDLYNSGSIGFLMKYPIKRIVLPVDLGCAVARALASQNSLEFEVVVGGRIPLAFSWRCYTARAHGLMRENCGFKCLEVPEIPLETLDGKPVFTINGPVILSGINGSLAEHFDEYRRCGFAAVRIDPARDGTLDMAERIKKVMSG